MAQLTVNASGGPAYSTAGGASVAPSYPTGISAGDTLVLVVGQKPATANGGGMTDPAGFTRQIECSGSAPGNTGGYSTTLAADSGNTNLYMLTATASGSESGTLSVTLTDNDVAWAEIHRVATIGTVSYAAARGTQAAGGNLSVTTGNLTVQSGDLLIGAFCYPTDLYAGTQFSAHSFTQTGGASMGASLELSEPFSSNGNDIGGVQTRALSTSGSGTGGVTMFASAATGGGTNGVRGPATILRIRQTGTVRVTGGPVEILAATAHAPQVTGANVSILAATAHAPQVNGVVVEILASTTLSEPTTAIRRMRSGSGRRKIRKTG